MAFDLFKALKGEDFEALVLAIVGLRVNDAAEIVIDPAEVLESKVQELIRGLGYPDAPADSVLGYEFDYPQRAYQWETYQTRDPWLQALKIEPTPVRFVYRQSPSPIMAENIGSQGEVQRNDPPQLTAGMVTVDAAMDGRLLGFLAIPPEKQPLKPDAHYDWTPLFAAAKLDVAGFQETTPEWTPIVETDQRAAWSGLYPGNNIDVNIEAGAFQGKPVYFKIVWPWTSPDRTPRASSLGDRRATARHLRLCQRFNHDPGRGAGSLQRQSRPC